MNAGRSLDDDAARLAQGASHVALCIDFDGTLAPIVADPETSRPLAGAIELLTRLAARYAAVALISGRPAAFLAEHAAAPGVRYLGLYGLQEIQNGAVWVDPRLIAARAAVLEATRDLQAADAVISSGAHLEDKEYAIAVHTRRIADPERWATAIDTTASDVARRRGLEVIPGRLVWELRPAVRGDKGDAVRKVVSESGARSVVVIGDDLGDLPAFAAAAGLAADGFEALRIGVKSPEAPPELLEQADVLVPGPAGVLAFLQLLDP